MAEATEENKPLLDYLKPLLVSAGGAVLGLLVMPVAIAQYPDFFNRNPWILPVSTAVAIICFILPLPLHPRTRRISVKIASITYIGKPLLAIVCLGAIVGAVVGAIRLIRFHREHLASVIASSIPAAPVASMERKNVAPVPAGKVEETGRPKRRPHIQAIPTSRPYDLTGERRTGFLSLVKPPKEASTLRVGCVAWSERSCVAAGQFLVLFSEAGWKIDGNRVFRMEPLIPNDGVFIISQAEPGAPLPPHLGRWHEESISEITLSLAFTKIGLVPHGSSDASLGKGVIGIYFGPEPAALKVDEQLVVADQITKFLFEGTAIEQQFSYSNDATAESREENEWATRVEAWLRTSSHEPVAVQFRNSRGIQAKKKCLLALLQQIVVVRNSRKLASQ